MTNACVTRCDRCPELLCGVCVYTCVSVCVLQGTVVDMRGQAMQDLPEGNPQPGPVYNGEPQVLGPGFAPFKPYLRPKFFHLKVSAGGACCVCTTSLVFVAGDVFAALERFMFPLRTYAYVASPPLLPSNYTADRISLFYNRQFGHVLLLRPHYTRYVTLYGGLHHCWLLFVCCHGNHSAPLWHDIKQLLSLRHTSCHCPCIPSYIRFWYVGSL